MSEHKKDHGLKHSVEEIDHALFEAESFVEKFIFGKRLWVLLAFLLITAYLPLDANGDPVIDQFSYTLLE